MGISEPAVGWAQIMRPEAWLKPYLDPEFFGNEENPWNELLTPSSSRTSCTLSIRHYLHELYLQASLPGGCLQLRVKEGREFSLEPTPYSGTGGSTRLHPVMHSSSFGPTAAPSTCMFRKKGKTSWCPEFTMEINVKTTSDRQTKQGQFGQGFLAALSFLNMVAVQDPNEWWFERAGWVEGVTGKVHPWHFWGDGRVVIVQRAFRVETVFTEKIPFTETTTTEDYRLNPEH